MEQLFSALGPYLPQIAGGIGLVPVVMWGREVTKLLGNHLRHDLADQTEVLRSIKTAMEDQTTTLRTMNREIRELRHSVDSPTHCPILKESLCPRSPSPN